MICHRVRTAPSDGLLPKPITKHTANPVNQSKIEVNTCSWRVGCIHHLNLTATKEKNDYNIVRALVLYTSTSNSYGVVMVKISIYARLCVNNMTRAVSVYLQNVRRV